MTPDTPATPAAAAVADLPQPQAGGSYTRCPETGALQQQHATQPPGAESLRHHADDDGATAAANPAQEP